MNVLIEQSDLSNLSLLDSCFRQSANLALVPGFDQFGMAHQSVASVIAAVDFYVATNYNSLSVSKEAGLELRSGSSHLSCNTL